MPKTDTVARVRRPRMRRTRVKPVRPLATVAAQPNSRSAVNVAEVALDAWKNLSPLAQHELSVLRPGELKTPFVESNGVASRLATAVIAGQFTSNIPSSSTKSSMVVVSPMACLTGAAGVSYAGIKVLNPNASDVMTLDEARGYTMTQVFGSTSYASKMLPYASRVEITMSVPLGNLSGIAYYGCVPLAVFVGATVADLVKTTVKTIDLKELGQRTFPLKAAINDRSLIHFVNNKVDTLGTSVAMTNPGELSEEWISFFIVSSKAAMDYSGSPMAYDINITAHSNVVWWPISTTPTLSTIVAKEPIPTKATSPREDHFSKVAETHQANPEPSTLNKVCGFVKSLCDAGSSLPVVGEFAKVGSMIAGAAQSIFSDGVSEQHDYTQIIEDIRFFLSVIRQKWGYVSDPELAAQIS